MSFYRYKYVLLAVVLVFGIPGSAPAPHNKNFSGSKSGITARSEVPASLLGVFQNALKAQKVQLEAELNAAKSVQILLRKVRVTLRKNPTPTSAKEGDNLMIARALSAFLPWHRGIGDSQTHDTGTATYSDPATRGTADDLANGDLQNWLKIAEANQAELVKEINVKIKNLGVVAPNFSSKHDGGAHRVVRSNQAGRR